MYLINRISLLGCFVLCSMLWATVFADCSVPGMLDAIKAGPTSEVCNHCPPDGTSQVGQIGCTPVTGAMIRGCFSAERQLDYLADVVGNFDGNKLLGECGCLLRLDRGPTTKITEDKISAIFVNSRIITGHLNRKYDDTFALMKASSYGDKGAMPCSVNTSFECKDKDVSKFLKGYPYQDEIDLISGISTIGNRFSLGNTITDEITLVKFSRKTFSIG